MSDTLTRLACEIADQLTDGGVVLTIKPDSILAPIAGEVLRPLENITTDSTESLIKTTNTYFKGLSPNPFMTSLENEDVLGNAVEIGTKAMIADLTPIVLNIIDTIRNKVIPVTNSIFERAYKTTSEEVDRGGVLLDVVTDGSEKQIWSNSALQNIMSSSIAGEDLSAQVISGMVFPQLEASDLIERLHSVNQLLNADLDDLLGETIFTDVVKIYNQVFGVSGVEYEPISCERTRNLVGLLLSINFRDNPPEGILTTNDDTGNYNRAIDKLSDGLAVRLNQLIAHSVHLVKSNRLVVRYPAQGSEFKSGACIVVNGLIYEGWLNAGGTVDAILGAYAMGGTTTSAQTILEEKTRFEREWVRRVGLAQSRIKDDFERVFVNALRKEIFVYAKEDDLKVNNKGIEMMFERSSSINPDNAYSFARRSVVHCLFPDGDFLEVLEEIDSVAARVPGIEKDDAIEIGIIDWLVGWALKSVAIDRI